MKSALLRLTANQIDMIMQGLHKLDDDDADKLRAQLDLVEFNLGQSTTESTYADLTALNPRS